MSNPIDTKVISKLAEILDKNQLTTLNYEDESCKISLTREISGGVVPAYVPAPQPVAAAPVAAAPVEEEVKETVEEIKAEDKEDLSKKTVAELKAIAKEKGIEIANVTLHVGIGTFRPVKEDEVEKHDMHTEHYYIKKEDADKINNAKKNGKRIISVGTTSCRVLETVADENGLVKEIEGDTNIFIYPGYKFKCVDNLITNFHLPQSTLLMLVSALSDKDFMLEAYKEAVKDKYRFFSFGDAMYIC